MQSNQAQVASGNQPDVIPTCLINDEPDPCRRVQAVPDDLRNDGKVVLGSFVRLRSAVVELIKVLGETFPDEDSGTSECLRRAGAVLEAVEQRATPAPITSRAGLQPWQIRRILNYIEANLDKSIRNRELAAVVRLSEFHFNVAFRNSVGDSPHEYVIRRRIERSQGLMLSTDAPLSQIAADCGLADQAHFTRLFRKIVGETPAAWRRARANPAGC